MRQKISQIKIAGNYARWEGIQQLPSLDYVCWHCNTEISSDIGYRLDLPTAMYNSADPSYPDTLKAGIYLCHRCGYPTFLLNGKQIPGIPFGKSFEHVPDIVNNIYNEARDCYSVNAFTAVVLLCRKILMHIAVERGADENKNFVYYVDYLKEHNLITATSRDWVDKIRQVGNNANHELVQEDSEEAKRILTFTSMLLMTTYEYPAMEKELN